MKIVLSQDVKGQGKKGEIIEVSDGYGKNFLLKNKLGVVASASALNEAKQAEAAREHKKATEKADAIELKAKLDKLSLTLPVKVSEKGKIFGALTSQIIAEELNKQGLEVDRRKIVLEDNIKMVGKYSVVVKLYPEVSAVIDVNVVPL